MVLGICGGSGSGKSTLCTKLIEQLGKQNVTHLLQDNYYRDQPHLTLKERAKNNYDHPDSLEFELLQEHLKMVAQQNTLSSPAYDFTTHCRKPENFILDIQEIIILEGTLLFSQSYIRSHCHIKIFIDTSEDIRFKRRLNRDIEERGRTPESVLHQFKTSVAPMHNKFIEPHKSFADHIISGTDNLSDSVNQIIELIRFAKKAVFTERETT